MRMPGLFPTTWRLTPLWVEPMPAVAALQLGLPCPSGDPSVVPVREVQLDIEVMVAVTMMVLVTHIDTHTEPHLPPQPTLLNALPWPGCLGTLSCRLRM
jgi:hypothetical protein